MRSVWPIAAVCLCVVTRDVHAQPAPAPAPALPAGAYDDPPAGVDVPAAPPDCPPGAHCEAVDVPPPERPALPIPDFCPPSPTCEGAPAGVAPQRPPTQDWPLKPRRAEPEDFGEPADEIPYNAGDPIPPGFQVESKLHEGVFFAGMLVFGLSYVPWGIIGFFSLESGGSIGYTLVPLVGPPALAIDYELSNELTVLLVANAGVQFVGLTLMALSPVVGDLILVPDGTASNDGPRFGLAPLRVHQPLGPSAGLAVETRF